MLSPTDRCRSFDESADGYARGEGCGLVLLKRLEDAVADGDNILGVISGSAVNSNGRTASVITPSVSQQRQLILKALEDAKKVPQDLTYLEAHGTGTQLGDTIEMEALNSIFSEFAVGSVKANIGHLESAAGIAGLVKVLAMMKHRSIPPHPCFQKINPRIDDRRAKICTQVERWSGQPLVAGVSSFGFSGTNAHVIISEPPKSSEIQSRCTAEEEGIPIVVIVSAKSESSLRAMAKKLSSVSRDSNLRDLAWTLNARPTFNHRLAIVAKNSGDLAEELKKFGDREVGIDSVYGVHDVGADSEVRPVFLFPGQGVEFFDVVRELFEFWPNFRQNLERCDEILKTLHQPSILELMGIKGQKEGEVKGEPQARGEEREEGEGEGDGAAWRSQVALFAVEWSLAHTLLHWGVKPSCLIGHSLGELAAACVAGEFSLAHGLALVVERARLLGRTKKGAMLATRASLIKIRELGFENARGVYVAAINGPDNVTLSGEEEHVIEAERELQASGIKTKRLATTHGFHSELVIPILGDFQEIASRFDFKRPALFVGDSVYGKILDPTSDSTRDAKHWTTQIRACVNFFGSLESASRAGYPQIFLEVGPTSLLSIVSHVVEGERQGKERNGSRSGLPVLLPTMRRSGRSALAFSVAKLFVLGVPISWARVNPSGKFIPELPTYQFNRKRCWLDIALSGEKNPRRPQEVLPSPENNSELKESIEVSRDLRKAVRRLVHNIYGRKILDSENLLHLGMDSLMATEIRLSISSLIPGDSSLPGNFLEGQPTIESIVSFLKRRKRSKSTGRKEANGFLAAARMWHPRIKKNEKVSALPVSGIQRAYWIGKQSLGGSGGHLYREYEIFAEVDPEILSCAFSEMIQRHEILRAVVTEDGLLQILSQVPKWTPKYFKSGTEDAEIASACERLQEGPNIHNWPLFDVCSALLSTLHCLPCFPCLSCCFPCLHCLQQALLT
jgi:acyl transferase domain-containing protein